MEIEEDESVFSMETKMTTKNMQIETGVTILIISSPSVSRMPVGLEACSIRISKIRLIFEFRWCSVGVKK